MTDHTPLTDEELAQFVRWREHDGYLGGAAVDRLIAALRAARAEVEMLVSQIAGLRAVIAEQPQARTPYYFKVDL